MNLFSSSRLPRSRFACARHHPVGTPTKIGRTSSSATLSRDELLREVIAVIG